MLSSSYIAGQSEVGVISHNGREFASGGSSVNGRHVTGYSQVDGRLTRWDGSHLLPAGRYNCWDIWHNHDGESIEVVGWNLGAGRWVVGLSLGDGMLFRGELVTADDEDDARDQARGIAESIATLDAEDAEQDPERWDGLA